ncbi:MAG: 4Fe-4S binding protein [Bacteroidales bacterium]
MQIKRITFVYFSATNTTRKIVKEIASHFDTGKVEYNLINYPIEEEIILSPQELLIVGMPVYSGRIPEIAVASLRNIKGLQTPAIISCIYGNRDYDDALIEIQDLVEANGFRVISAAAFIAQHSIMPEVAANRPDKSDIEKIQNFSVQTSRILSQIETVNDIQQIKIKGNRPYKTAKKVPLRPEITAKLCDRCNSCISQCPTGAISDKFTTDKTLCISCGRCIYICPQKARSYKGILYNIAKMKFVRDNKERKEPKIYYASY